MFSIFRFTPKSQDWFKQTNSFRVLHQREKILYLKNQAKQVLAIHDETLALTPFSLQIDRFPAFLDWFSIHQPAIKSARAANRVLSLTTESGSASFAGGSLWRPDEIQFQQLKGWGGTTHLSEETAGRFNHLITALRSRETNAIIKATRRLAGLGSGLTPTGDDLIIGTIYALFALGWHSTLIAQIGKSAAAQTTSLSAAFLLAASVGEAAESWHRVMDQEPGALEKLLATGHRSGQEAWYGFNKTIGELSNG